MRLNYSDNEEYPGQFALWQANCQRSLRGRRGQASLRALKAALLALPEKRLIAHEIQDDTGAVCAVGALAKQQQRNLVTSDPDETVKLGEQCGLPHLVAWKVVEENDITLDAVTAEQRYDQMLRWIEEHLR